MHLTRADRARIRALFPDGVAPRRALIELGVSASALTRSCRAGGPWQSPVRGVILLSAGELTPLQRIQVALAKCGDGAVLTGVTAARRHGVRRLPEDHRVYVLVPNQRQLGSDGFVVVSRTRRMPRPILRNGLPLAPLARGLADAAAHLNQLDAVRAMFADAVQRGLCTPTDLAAELAVQQRPRTALARMVLSEVADGVRSAAEAWARRLVIRSGLPAPAWNVAVHRRDGRLIGVADAWWDDVGLVWEIDSREWHLSPQEHDRDTRRQSGFAAEGIHVVHTRPGRLLRDRAAVLDELVRAHAQASRTPRPDVVTYLWRPSRPHPAT
ncbi:hypothetical protein ACFQE5_20910 [Pseudonocardia hispaniensis]|uniref:Transcriptional regulator, AbiEi antitoxin, Type IV TA system n=1 Tax=Pseudonocardia hispaniensis TaxID=904933 RepID=A0ABW1J6Z0_9PSEU